MELTVWKIVGDRHHGSNVLCEGHYAFTFIGHQGLFIEGRVLEEPIVRV